jgi:hypothetical protein
MLWCMHAVHSDPRQSFVFKECGDWHFKSNKCCVPPEWNITLSLVRWKIWEDFKEVLRFIRLNCKLPRTLGICPATRQTGVDVYTTNPGVDKQRIKLPSYWVESIFLARLVWESNRLQQLYWPNECGVYMKAAFIQSNTVLFAFTHVNFLIIREVQIALLLHLWHTTNSIRSLTGLPARSGACPGFPWWGFQKLILTKKIDINY